MEGRGYASISQPGEMVTVVTPDGVAGVQKRDRMRANANASPSHPLLASASPQWVILD
jgi:hypothetical protein